MPTWHNTIVSVRRITIYNKSTVAIAVPVAFPKDWKTKLRKKIRRQKNLKTKKIV